ncbi:hypothetical protein LPN01_09920 [Sphingomonas sp. A2-49]|uniref:PilZ domain-containing protein n=1 Tax=Sphingomonas sp. A2-49 TaxID=1391375 RepID=UPI0021D22562|nr:PilZ domain-containing protein [Sphingomonas sp. A2-49]MCU6454393.1 hypothetical protein [Sphingomonas sp. A2-49]
MRQREPRRKVLVRARMRCGADWGDVTIHNMSSRGLLATSETECRTGTIVEIRRIHHVIVGRVVWQKGLYFGIRTQDRIDIDGIVAARPPAHKPDTRSGTDRRNADRPSVSIADREAGSRRFARAFQFAVAIAVVVAVALILASEVSGVLSRPFAVIGAHLDGSAARSTDGGMR